MTAEWCERKINRFSELADDDDEKNELIEELFIKLASLTSLELKNIACTVDFVRLFAELTSNNSLYIEELCKTLSLLFCALEPGYIHQHYSSEIHHLLSHRNPSVKILILQELDRTAKDRDKVERLVNDVNLLTRVIETIGDDSLKVAMVAMNTIKSVSRNPDCTKIIYTGNLLRTFARLLAKNDTITFRVYEVIVDIANSSKEGLETTANSGFLTSLLQIIDSDDILLQLNALESLTELASTESGLNYLEERNVLQKFSDQIARANENPLSNLLIPGLMKFFGNIARNRPDEIFSKYPIVISALFQVIDSDDYVLLANALDTLGHIASSVNGKYALQSLGDAMPRVMKRIGEIIDKLPTESRIRGLNNLALILHIDDTIKQDNRILSLTKFWFDSMHDDPLKFIVTLCNQPFADIRFAGMQVLLEIASQSWGQEYITNLPGLVEFLLDRNAEGFSNCKEIKYQIVKELSKPSCDAFDSSTLQQLREFVRQGPFYVDLATEVATEPTE